MTRTPHDALFKAAFENPEHAAGLFRSMLPATVVEAIAWDTVACEPGSFIDPELAGRHSDLLFSVDLRGGRAFLYLLLEHQSTNDPDMPLRMLTYLARIWERFRKVHEGDPLPPIIPALVSHAPGGWTAPRSFHDMFAPAPASIAGLAQFVPSFTLMVEDLAHLSNEDIKARALATFPTLALWVLRDARDATQLLNNLGHWGAAFAEAACTPHGVAALAQLVRYIALVSDELRLEAFRAKIREQAPEAEQAAMTIAEQIRQEVSEQMLREGEVKGQRTMLTKLLVLKFKRLTPKHEARIAGATAEQLDGYVERVLTAEAIDDVFESLGSSMVPGAAVRETGRQG
ncbi:Rpn family recombination-promoting nuclease/putative transposase [Paraliomyxa miuraensis]|uniref:Rpn family recombination-promoting nuclease/putative transposase n=1 Tax=Paraliomyxa miuraensis TaxID=376150 RepID=UPI00225B1586|nr:Rpn family recombination-promoting nuclease/putative transposase [Paraliomyxa miuraensis]MCX4244621.1 Rpn family recombination-promoting nuclease/putative transposase [Paraliomyxa miuraensis]